MVGRRRNLPTTVADGSVCLIEEDAVMTGMSFEAAVNFAQKGKVRVMMRNHLHTTIRLRSGVFMCTVRVAPKEVQIVELEDEPEGIYVSMEQKSPEDDKVEVNTLDFPGVKEELDRLLKRFRNSIALGGDDLGRTNVLKHRIKLKPGTSPVYIPAYRFPHSRKEAIKTIVQDLKAKGVIEDSESPWNFPLILVPKKTNEWRPCVDYRRLNDCTTPDRYPMPVLTELLQGLGKASVFSSLDLISGYHQVSMDPESKELTAFSTPEGHYQFKVMPFGLRNAPTTFSRLMDLVLKGIKGVFVLSYLDDIIVYSKNEKEHLRHLEQVLTRLQTAGLKLRLSKCEFFKKRLQFLGHVVDATGVHTQSDKINKVKNWPDLKDKKEVQRFLGLAGYYRAFVPDYTKVAHPIIKLTREEEPFVWGPEQSNAFQALKDRLTSAPILRFPDYEKTFYLATDASAVGLGACLMQYTEKRLMPIAYASRLLKPAERNYSVTQQEALGVVWAL
ncbi:MAG: reverse transcriptase family protein, partial [Cyanobacteria bacterium J06553_1]